MERKELLLWAARVIRVQEGADIEEVKVAITREVCSGVHRVVSTEEGADIE
jgi:hypothetical protein